MLRLAPSSWADPFTLDPTEPLQGCPGARVDRDTARFGAIIPVASKAHSRSVTWAATTHGGF
jgi:hypothetical protein